MHIGGRSVGIVRLRTKGHRVCFFVCFVACTSLAKFLFIETVSDATQLQEEVTIQTRIQGREMENNNTNKVSRNNKILYA
jgi:hypothetical protein